MKILSTLMCEKLNKASKAWGIKDICLLIRCFLPIWYMGGNKNDKNYELKNTYDKYIVVGGALSNTSLTKNSKSNVV